MPDVQGAGLLDMLPPGLRDSELLQQALTHRSAAAQHNERLEFLGDSILNMVIAERVFRLRPAASEGDLSRLRASLVNRDSLAEIARKRGLGDLIRLGEGERKSGGRRRDSILADGLEAVIGAVFLVRDFATARSFVLDLYAERLRSLPDAEAIKDPKTRLQEWLQGRGMEVPEYVTLEVSGEAHDRHFSVACHVAALGLRASGQGSSRRAAEQVAAASAMRQIEAGDA